MLADKTGKSTMCSFDSLVALRKNIVAKVAGRIEEDSKLVQNVKTRISQLKADAKKDFEEWNSKLLGKRGTPKKDRSKRTRKREKSSAHSRSRSVEKKSRKDKNRKDKSKTDAESESSSSSSESSSDDGGSKKGCRGKKDKKRQKLNSRGRSRGRDEDDDLWSDRFTPSTANRSQSGGERPSDELLEMLNECVNENFKQQSDPGLQLVKSCFYSY